MKIRLKPVMVDSVGGPVPMACYRLKPIVVEAEQLTTEQIIRTADGPIHAAAGDWVITRPDGTLGVCRGENFARYWEPVPDLPTGHQFGYHDGRYSQGRVPE